MRSYSFRNSVLLALVVLCLIPGVQAQFNQQGKKLVGRYGAVELRSEQGAVGISGDGNTAIVGGPLDDYEAGAAWVYTRSGGLWTQQGPKLVGTGAVGIALQGVSVAVSGDGNTAIVGGEGDNHSIGAAWVFTRSGGVWSQQGGKLVGTGTLRANQGYSVAISGDGNTAIVGGPYDDGAGAAWVFTRSGGVWSQQGTKLVGTGAVGESLQGYSVSISGDGNTAVIGGEGDDNGVGAVWVFTRTGGVWIQWGTKLVGTGAVGGAWQGYSVSISGDSNTVIEGGPLDNLSGNYGSGAVWVFTRTGGVWTQQGTKLVGTGATNSASQGYSVSVSDGGNTLVEGGNHDDNFTGAAWVFTRSGGVWTQQGNKLVGTGAMGDASQGNSVSISGDSNTVIEGGPYDGYFLTGAAWVFAQS